MNDNDFIKEIKEKNDRYGVSQSKLAAAVGISREHFSGCPVGMKR